MTNENIEIDIETTKEDTDAKNCSKMHDFMDDMGSDESRDGMSLVDSLGTSRLSHSDLTKDKITFLENRLTSWIKEIDNIDVRIEKSIETSKSIPYKRSPLKLSEI